MKQYFKLVLLLLISCNSVAQKKTTITADEYEKATQSKSVQLVDVRRPEEFKEGHLKGAVLANWQDPAVFKEVAGKLDKNKPVYVYCKAGVRGDKAADWLTQNGFKEVVNLEGGIQSWIDAGKPVEK